MPNEPGEYGDQVISVKEDTKRLHGLLTSDWQEKHKGFLAPIRIENCPCCLGTCLRDSSHPTGLFFVAIFFCPFRLALASAICPWVSEDVPVTAMANSFFVLNLISFFLFFLPLKAIFLFSFYVKTAEQTGSQEILEYSFYAKYF